MTEIFVDRAQHYKESNMGTFGKASSMLICQYQFPFSFDSEKEEIASAHLDRLNEWDKPFTERCFHKYGMTEMYLEHELRSKSPRGMLLFIAELLKVSKHKEWTGFRVLGTVGGNGHDYYCFQIFSKHPETDTLVYTGDEAPNVC